MKKLLLIALLIMGCDNSTEVTDCAGVAGGTAVEDECGVCGGSGYSACLNGVPVCPADVYLCEDVYGLPPWLMSPDICPANDQFCEPTANEGGYLNTFRFTNVDLYNSSGDPDDQLLSNPTDDWIGAFDPNGDGVTVLGAKRASMEMIVGDLGILADLEALNLQVYGTANHVGIVPQFKYYFAASSFTEASVRNLYPCPSPDQCDNTVGSQCYNTILPIDNTEHISILNNQTLIDSLCSILGENPCPTACDNCEDPKILISNEQNENGMSCQFIRIDDDPNSLSAWTSFGRCGLSAYEVCSEAP